MENRGKIAAVGLWSVFLMVLSSCVAFEVKQNVKNPHRYFRNAYRQIEKIHSLHPNREGRATCVHFLIYESSRRKLIRATVPVWVTNGCRDLGKRARRAQDLDFEGEYDIDWEGISDLGQIGPGLLFELSDTKSKVLIWLE
ncbi:MAG: hypothetical protein ACE5L7_08425 [Candidatus Aminicenantales bacterium]